MGELAEIEDFEIMKQDQQTIKEVIEINLGDSGLSPGDLERVEFPTGGDTFWQLPTLGDSMETAEEFNGVIINQQNIRVYWEKSYAETGGDESPDCYSPDGITGYGSENVEWDQQKCSECPMDVWGSGENGGKACKEKKNLYFIEPDKMLPTLLRVPPTSLNALKNYLMKLTSRGIPFHSVVTKFGLNEASNDNFEYSELDLSVHEQLSDEESEKMRVISEEFKHSLENEPVPINEPDDDTQTVDNT